MTRCSWAVECSGLWEEGVSENGEHRVTGLERH